MIIKSMSRKTASFEQLLSYINKGEQGKNPAIFHNLNTHTDHIKTIAQEFTENAQCIPQRKNGIFCYHEVLALPETKITKEKGNDTLESLEDIAREYLEHRAPNALAYAKVHLDTDHPHIHFLISSNDIKQKKKNWIQHSEFEQIKREIGRYQKIKYPELSPTKPKKHKTINQNHKKGETIKQTLQRKIAEIFASERCFSDALVLLRKSDIEPYKRGKYAFYGVIYKGKKYRLSTLGVREFVDNRVRQWTRTESRLLELERIREVKGKAKEKTKSLKDDFLAL